MATTYTSDETSTRSFVLVQYKIPGEPTKIYWNRTYMSYDTNSLTDGNVLLVKHYSQVISYATDIEVRVAANDDIIGADLTDPSRQAIFNAFGVDTGASRWDIQTITSAGDFNIMCDPTGINYSGNTDVQIATLNEGENISASIGLATIRNATESYKPLLWVYTVIPTTPSTINTPTTINTPITINTPSAEYNVSFSARVNGDIRADVDESEPPAPTE